MFKRISPFLATLVLAAMPGVLDPAAIGAVSKKTFHLKRSGVTFRLEEGLWKETALKQSTGIKAIDLFLENRKNSNQKRFVITQLYPGKIQKSQCMIEESDLKKNGYSVTRHSPPKGWGCVLSAKRDDKTHPEKKILAIRRVLRLKRGKHELWSNVIAIDTDTSDLKNFHHWIQTFEFKKEKKKG